MRVVLNSQCCDCHVSVTLWQKVTNNDISSFRVWHSVLWLSSQCDAVTKKVTNNDISSFRVWYSVLWLSHCDCRAASLLSQSCGGEQTDMTGPAPLILLLPLSSGYLVFWSSLWIVHLMAIIYGWVVSSAGRLSEALHVIFGYLVKATAELLLWLHPDWDFLAIQSSEGDAPPGRRGMNKSWIWEVNWSCIFDLLQMLKVQLWIYSMNL